MNCGNKIIFPDFDGRPPRVIKRSFYVRKGTQRRYEAAFAASLRRCVPKLQDALSDPVLPYPRLMVL